MFLHATLRGRADVVKVLLAHENVETDPQAVVVAAAKGHTAVLQLLLNHGAVLIEDELLEAVRRFCSV